MNGDEQEWMGSQSNAIPSSPRPAQHGTRISYEISGTKVPEGGSPNYDEDDEDDILDLMASIRMHMIVDKSYPRSESSNVRRMAEQYPLKTRSRPLKPHEPPPFLTVDSLQEKSKASAASPSEVSKVSGITSKEVTPRSLRESRHSSGAPPPIESRPISATTSQQSVPESPRRPNVHVQAPFKHAVHKPAMSTDKYPPPCQELQHQTLLAQRQMCRLLTTPRRSPPRKKYGRLLKAKLKPLYPVEVSGPTIQQCRGILAEKRSYSASANKTLMRRRQLMARWNAGELGEFLRQPMEGPSTLYLASPSPLDEVQSFNQQYLDTYLDQVGAERGEEEEEVDVDNNENGDVDLLPSPIPSPRMTRGEVEKDEGSEMGTLTPSTMRMRKLSPLPCNGDMLEANYPDFTFHCNSEKSSVEGLASSARGSSGKDPAKGRGNGQTPSELLGDGVVSTSTHPGTKKYNTPEPLSENANNNALQDEVRLDSEPPTELNAAGPVEIAEGATQSHARQSSSGQTEDNTVLEAPVGETGDVQQSEAESGQIPDDSAEVTPAAKGAVSDEAAGESSSPEPSLMKSHDDLEELALQVDYEKVRKPVENSENAPPPETEVEPSTESPEKDTQADKGEVNDKPSEPVVRKSKDERSPKGKESGPGVREPSGDENSPPGGDGKRLASADSAAKSERQVPHGKGRSLSQGDIHVHVPDGNTNNNGLSRNLSSSKAMIRKPILVNRSGIATNQAAAPVQAGGEAVTSPTSSKGVSSPTGSSVFLSGARPFSASPASPSDPSFRLPLSRPQTAGEMLKDRQPSRGKSVRFADNVVQTARRGQSAGALSTLGRARKAVRSGRATCKPYMFSVSSQGPDDEDKDRKSFGMEDLRINSIPISAPGEKRSPGPAAGSRQPPRGQTRSVAGTTPRDEGGADQGPRGSHPSEDIVEHSRSRSRGGKHRGQEVMHGHLDPDGDKRTSSQCLYILRNSAEQPQRPDTGADLRYSYFQDSEQEREVHVKLTFEDKSLDPEAMVPSLKNLINMNLDDLQGDRDYNYAMSDFSEDSNDISRERIIWKEDVEHADPAKTEERTSTSPYLDEESAASATGKATGAEKKKKKKGKTSSSRVKKKLSQEKSPTQPLHKVASQRRSSDGDVKTPRPAAPSTPGDSTGPDSEGDQGQASFKKDKSGRVKGLVLQGLAQQPQEAEFPMSLSVRKFQPQAFPLKPHPSSAMEQSKKEGATAEPGQQVHEMLEVSERIEPWGSEVGSPRLGRHVPTDQREFLLRSQSAKSFSSAKSFGSIGQQPTTNSRPCTSSGISRTSRGDSSCKVSLPELLDFLEDPRCQELIDLKPDWPRSNHPTPSHSSVTPLWKMHPSSYDVASQQSRQEGSESTGWMSLPEYLLNLPADEREQAVLEFLQSEGSLAVDENWESEFATQTQGPSLEGWSEEPEIIRLVTESEEDFDDVTPSHADHWRSNLSSKTSAERGSAFQPRRLGSFTSSARDESSNFLEGRDWRVQTTSTFEDLLCSCPEGLAPVDPFESDSFNCPARPGTMVSDFSGSKNHTSSDPHGSSDFSASPNCNISISPFLNTNSTTPATTARAHSAHSSHSELPSGGQDRPASEQGRLVESLQKMTAILEHLKQPLNQTEVGFLSSGRGNSGNTRLFTPAPNSSCEGSIREEEHHVVGATSKSRGAQRLEDQQSSPAPSSGGARSRDSSVPKERSPASSGMQLEDSLLEEVLRITRDCSTPRSAEESRRTPSTASSGWRSPAPNSVCRQGQMGSQSKQKSSSAEQLVPHSPGRMSPSPIAPFSPKQHRASVMDLFAGSEIPDPEASPALTHSVHEMRVVGKPPGRKSRPGVPRPRSPATPKRSSPMPCLEKEDTDSVKAEEGKVDHLDESPTNLMSFQELEEAMLKVKEELRQQLGVIAHQNAVSKAAEEHQASLRKEERRVTFLGGDDSTDGSKSPSTDPSRDLGDPPPTEGPGTELPDSPSPDPFARLREFRRQCWSVGPGCLMVPEQLVSSGGLGRQTKADAMTGPSEKRSSVEEAAAAKEAKAAALAAAAAAAAPPEQARGSKPALAAFWPVFDGEALTSKVEKRGAKHHTSLLEVITDALPEPESRSKSSFSGESTSPLEVIASPVILRKPKKNQKKKPKDMVARFPPLCFQINTRPPQGHFFYFAYGLDMDKDRLSFFLKHDVERRYWGLLYGFSLAFNKQGLDLSAGGFPTLEYDPYNSVEGCVYVLKVEYAEWLDKCVGAPLHYARVILPVWMSNSRDPNMGVAQYCVACMMYIAQDDWVCKEGKLNCAAALNQCMKNTDILSPDYIQYQRSKHQASPTDSASQPPPVCVSA